VALDFADDDAATNAVREAARYGAAADASSPDRATSVRTRLQQTYADDGRTATDDQICVTLMSSTDSVLQSADGPDCGSAPRLPDGMAPGSCVVLVWLQKPETIDLGVFPSIGGTIHASSVAYYGRTVAAGGGGPLCTAS